MSDLPPSWEWTPIEDIVDVLDSRRVPVNAKERAKRQGDVPYYGATGQVGWIDDSLFYEELVLLGEDGAPFLDPAKPKAYLIDGPSWVNNHAHVLRARAEASTNRFLKYALDAVDYRPHVNGTTRLKLTQKAMRRMPIPLPPVAEQERIVAAIEEHLSRLDAANEAVVSALTRLGQMAAKVKQAVVTEAQSIPLADLALESRYGTSVKCDYVSSGPGVIRIPNIVDERVDVEDLKYAIDPSGVPSDVMLRDGDVVFVRTNGSRDLIGRAAVASGEAVGLGFASYLIRYRLRNDVDPEYLCAVVSAPSTRRVLEGLAATTAGQYNLSVSKLDSLAVPLPPLEEQRRLFDGRSEGLAIIGRLVEDLRAAQRRSASLRRSILTAAFSGRLVAQDPDDEPASVLLERIRAERAADTPTNRKRKAKAT